METTTNKTDRRCKTSKPVKPTKALAIVQLFANRLLQIFVMASFMILSTSYQSGRGAIDRYESDYAVPEFKLSFQNFFTTNASINLPAIANTRLATFPLIRTFYTENDFAPVWTLTNTLNANAYVIIRLLNHARYYGLEPENYHVQVIKNLDKEFQDPSERKNHPQIREQLELLLTDATFKFMMNLHMGYQVYDSIFFRNNWVADLPEQMKTIVKNRKSDKEILSMQPVFVEYVRLQRATENFIKHVDLTDEVIEITDPRKDSAQFWNAAKEILIRLGYISENADSLVLTEALKTFQKFHGLEPDGKPGKNTQDALSKTTLYNYKMLALNLDRLRKENEETTRMLYINIPSYELKVIQENKIQSVYRVIVGNPETPTPLMTAYVDKIITNPEWNVPQSIIANELLPKIKSDSNYLKKNRFKLIDTKNKTVDYQTIDWDDMTSDNFDYSLRQDASSDNALGRVKFIFENPYAVYLHDTPGKRLFDKDIRAFSHGCIRLQNPEKLAGYIVDQLDSEKIDVKTLIRNGVHREIDLKETFPIYIRYLTCDADENGQAYFYKDIYQIDEQDMADFLSLAGI